MRVLGLETSCDETGVALYDTEVGLVSDALYSQVAVHAEYGGVVPELASRDHIRKTLPLIDRVLSDAQLQKSDIDAIAYTSGPGLLGALIVGATIARSIAAGLGVPALGIHHMEGHLMAPLMSDDPPEYPFVALLVSGGHTQLIRANAFGDYQLLGESLMMRRERRLIKQPNCWGCLTRVGHRLQNLQSWVIPRDFLFRDPW